MLFHDLYELIEQIRGIVRTRPGLRMILHRIDREASVSEALDCVVIQIDVCDFAIRGK